MADHSRFPPPQGSADHYHYAAPSGDCGLRVHFPRHGDGGRPCIACRPSGHSLGQGGAFVPAPPGADELQREIDRLSREVDPRTDELAALESRLLEKRVRERLIPTTAGQGGFARLAVRSSRRPHSRPAGDARGNSLQCRNRHAGGRSRRPGGACHGLSGRFRQHDRR